jgi:hypothetical protein
VIEWLMKTSKRFRTEILNANLRACSVVNDSPDNVHGVNKVVIFDEANKRRLEMKIQNLLILVIL